MATTVATPSKWPGRAAPSSGAAIAPTDTAVSNPGGYTSSTAGAKTMSTPARSHASRSRASFRGYFAKSSRCPNWRGLTKIDTTTVALSARARSTSDTWPAWSHPIVGTRPIGRGAFARAARRSARVRTTSNRGPLQVAVERDPRADVARRGDVVGRAPEHLVEHLGVHQHRLRLARELALLDVRAVGPDRVEDR